MREKQHCRAAELVSRSVSMSTDLQTIQTCASSFWLIINLTFFSLLTWVSNVCKLALKGPTSLLRLFYTTAAVMKLWNEPCFWSWKFIHSNLFFLNDAALLDNAPSGWEQHNPDSYFQATRHWLLRPVLWKLLSRVCTSGEQIVSVFADCRWSSWGRLPELRGQPSLNTTTWPLRPITCHGPINIHQWR